jgi:hypothetical protein
MNLLVAVKSRVDTQESDPACKAAGAPFDSGLIEGMEPRPICKAAGSVVMDRIGKKLSLSASLCVNKRS